MSYKEDKAPQNKDGIPQNKEKTQEVIKDSKQDLINKTKSDQPPQAKFNSNSNDVIVHKEHEQKESFTLKSEDEKSLMSSKKEDSVVKDVLKSNEIQPIESNNSLNSSVQKSIKENEIKQSDPAEKSFENNQKSKESVKDNSDSNNDKDNKMNSLPPALDEKSKKLEEKEIEQIHNKEPENKFTLTSEVNEPPSKEEHKEAVIEPVKEKQKEAHVEEDYNQDDFEFE